jgi:hypothetical protein
MDENHHQDEEGDNVADTGVTSGSSQNDDEAMTPVDDEDVVEETQEQQLLELLPGLTSKDPDVQNDAFNQLSDRLASNKFAEDEECEAFACAIHRLGIAPILLEIIVRDDVPRSNKETVIQCMTSIAPLLYDIGFKDMYVKIVSVFMELISSARDDDMHRRLIDGIGDMLGYRTHRLDRAVLKDWVNQQVLPLIQPNFSLGLLRSIATFYSQLHYEFLQTDDTWALDATPYLGQLLYQDDDVLIANALQCLYLFSTRGGEHIKYLLDQCILPRLADLMSPAYASIQTDVMSGLSVIVCCDDPRIESLTGFVPFLVRLFETCPELTPQMTSGFVCLVKRYPAHLGSVRWLVVHQLSYICLDLVGCVGKWYQNYIRGTQHSLTQLSRLESRDVCCRDHVAFIHLMRLFALSSSPK